MLELMFAAALSGMSAADTFPQEQVIPIDYRLVPSTMGERKRDWRKSIGADHSFKDERDCPVFFDKEIPGFGSMRLNSGCTPGTLLSLVRYKAMEVLVRTLRARRPNGREALVDEYWDFVDMSPRRSGTDYVPDKRRFMLRSGQPIRELEEETLQNGRTGEILLVLGPVSPLTR